MEQARQLLEFVKTLLLGLVQGATEFFPVSSSGHLALTGGVLSSFLETEAVSLNYAIFLHFGTFFAVLRYYQKDVISLWRSTFAALVRAIGQYLKGSSKRLVDESSLINPYYFIASLVVTGTIGFVLRAWVRRWFGDLIFVGSMLVVNGVAVYVTGRFTSGYRKLADLDVVDYLIIGLAQGLAVLPGLSRFGFTLCAGLWRKLEWFEALKLSFMLSLPTVLAAGLLELDMRSTMNPPSALEIAAAALGILASTVGGYVAIRVLRKQGLHTRKRLITFGLYCIAMGAFSVTYIAFLG